MKRYLGAVLALTCASGSAQTSREMTAAELRSLILYRSQLVGTKAIDSGAIEHSFQTQFLNAALVEVTSVTLELVVTRDLKGEVFRSSPVSITSFRSECYPHVGSILPMSKTMMEANARFKRPTKFWTTADHAAVRIKSAKVWTGRGVPNTVGRLFTKMCVTQNAEMFKLFNRTPSLLKVKNEFNFTPILIAFAAADKEMIEFLQRKGLNPRQKSTRGHSGLFIAAAGNNVGNVQFALNLGCRINELLPNSKRTPIFNALRHRNGQMVRALLDLGANPNVVDVDGVTPLRLAVREGLPDAFNQLVRAKGKVDYHDSAGLGLMHDCVGNVKMFPHVRGAGLSVNDCTKKAGITPLMIAAARGSYQATTWLVKNGASVNAKDANGRTARDHARKGGIHSEDFFLRTVEAARGQRP